MQSGSNQGSAQPICDEVSVWKEAGAGTLGQREPAAETRRNVDRISRLTRTLEVEVIPRLLAAHRGLPRAIAANDPPANVSVSSALREGFVQAVVRGDAPALRSAIHFERARGVSVESVYCDLLAPTARRLGEMWENDDCDFATVTVALGLLQRLLRELSPEFGSEVEHPANGRRVLLLRAPDEQHSFGLSMVAEFFSRDGWEVVSGNAGGPLDPVSASQREWFDAVGFSVGSTEKMGWLAPCIASVRLHSRNRHVCVLVGGPLFVAQPQLVGQVGADGTSADAREAPELVERMLASRVTMI
jgi:methanogenic corrinoid protein MtbC1